MRFSILKLLLCLFIGFGSAMAEAPRRPEKSLYLSYEQRLVASYILLGLNESPEKQTEIMKRLFKTFKEWGRRPVQKIEVSNFEEFLDSHRGPWPNSYSLEKDLELIETGALRGRIEYTSPRPELLQQIQNYQANQYRYLEEWAKKQSLNSPKALSSMKMTTVFAQEILKEMAKEREFKLIPRAMIRGIMSPLNKILAGIMEEWQEQRLSSIAKISQDFAVSTDPSKQAFNKGVSFIMKEYANRLSDRSKKQIVSTLLSQSLTISIDKIFETVILNSGPHLQKLLQVVGEEVNEDSPLQKMMERLQSKLPPVSPILVKQIMEEERVHYDWVDYSLKPVGTGTVAQGNKATMHESQSLIEVVARFLKPGIEYRMKEDYQILMDIAKLVDSKPEFAKSGLPEMVPEIDDIHRTVTEELDLQGTIQRQETGGGVYPRQKIIQFGKFKNLVRLYVPKVYKSQSKRLHVQEFVPGKTMNEAVKAYPEAAEDLKIAVSEMIAETWIEEVLTRSGFFHSDLHKGNVLVHVTDEEIKVTLLDFGMGGQIDERTRMNLIRLGVALKLQKADLIAQTLWDLSNKERNRISEFQFKEWVTERNKTIPNEKSELNSVYLWVLASMRAGIKYPFYFSSINRGLWITDSLLRKSGSKKTVSSIAAKLLLKHPSKIMEALKGTNALEGQEVFDYVKKRIQKTTVPETRQCDSHFKN